MWKKGSYDVSNHKRFDHVNVIVCDNQQGQTTTKFDKVRKFCGRIKKISEVRDKLVPLIVALFVIIFVLIGVIVWLSVSIYLMNINIRPTTSDETDNDSVEATVTTSRSLQDRLVLPFPPTQQQLLQPTSMAPVNGAYSDTCIELLRSIFELTGKRTVMEEFQPRRRSHRKLRNTFVPFETTSNWERTSRDKIKNVGCDCGIIVPHVVDGENTDTENSKGQINRDSTNGNLEADITTKSFNISATVQDAEQISESISEPLTEESTSGSVDSEEDKSEEIDDDQNWSIYLSHGNTIIKMYQFPLIMARCGPYLQMISE